jgi:Hydrazine synthase alpha subunit middle domain
MKNLTRLTALALVVGILPASHAFTTGCGSDGNADTGAGVGAIIFIKRQHTAGAGAGATVNVAGGNGQVLDYERFEPGGQLVMLTPPRPDGVLKVITSDFTTADFNGADVSFDAKQVVFSMKRDGDDHYHVYTAQLTEGRDGKFEIHQRTGGPHDDINPIYIPGGRIAFVTNEMYTAMGTRADEYNHGRGVTQLATISVDGGDADRRLASQNLSHTVAPWMRFDGKIGYSRWEHLGGVNDVKLFAANPDGTQMLGLAGQHAKPSNSLFSVRELEPNVMIGIATTRERTIHAGALVKIDARNKSDAVCMDANVLDKGGRPCVDEENVEYTILTPQVPTSSGPSPVGRYREPSPLPDGRILVSWADGPVNDLSEQSVTPPDFGVFVFNPTTQKNQLIYNDRDTWELNAIAVAPRVEPPLIRDIIGSNTDPGTPVRIGSVDITKTSLTDTVKGAQFGDQGVPMAEALKQAVKVRVIEGFSSEGAKGVPMFGLTMDEGAAILGEADVNPDGSWLAEIPPYVPVHLQPIDKFGLAIRNQRLWIQGMPGEDRRCIGCHEQRSGIGAPSRGQNPTVAEQRQAQQFLMPIADRVELPWALQKDYPVAATPKILIQNILDQKCVQCHSGGANDPFAGRTYQMSATLPNDPNPQTLDIPYLDLSSEEIKVVYDRKTASYPKSYVSLFFPATLEMGMGVSQIAGERPPLWAIPNNARESAMIKKLNVRAPDGSFAYGNPTMHPEDKGVELTDAERLILIQSIDAGGQFYARQNTGFVPFSSDPVAPGTKY